MLRRAHSPLGIGIIHPMSRTAHPSLWLLPLAVAVIPFIVTHVAWWLSLAAGTIVACNPYLEGCTSISRAARYGVSNTLFQIVMVPMAAVHAAMWFAARRWLCAQHPLARRGASLVPLGLIAASALAVYALALGTEGDLYRWMRRFGIIFYFAGTYLAQLVFLHCLGQLSAPPTIAQRGMSAIAWVLLLMGLASTVISNAVPDEVFKNQMENILEWHLGLLMTVWFVLMAWRMHPSAGSGNSARRVAD